MLTAKKKTALLWGLAIVWVALEVFTTPLRDGTALAQGLEIISGNDRTAIFEPMTEPALVGVKTKGAGTEISI